MTPCSICLDPILPCQPILSLHKESGDLEHIFHRSCLAEWRKSSPTCPLCRTRVTQSEEDAIAGIEQVAVSQKVASASSILDSYDQRRFIEGVRRQDQGLITEGLNYLESGGTANAAMRLAILMATRFGQDSIVERLGPFYIPLRANIPLCLAIAIYTPQDRCYEILRAGIRRGLRGDEYCELEELREQSREERRLDPHLSEDQKKFDEAVIFNDLDLLTTLVERASGSSISIDTNFGIWIASRLGYGSIVEFFLERKMITKAGWSLAIQAAADEGKDAIVLKLLTCDYALQTQEALVKVISLLMKNRRFELAEVVDLHLTRLL